MIKRFFGKKLRKSQSVNEDQRNSTNRTGWFLVGNNKIKRVMGCNNFKVEFLVGNVIKFKF